MKEIQKKKKSTRFLDNSGSTFIIVMVAVGFLTVLGTIIIAVSGANLRMKQVEYAAKHNFYTDEKILDDIYHGIGKVATECLAKSYAEVLAQVTDEYGAGYETQDAAFKAFSEKFVAKLKVKYPAGGYQVATRDLLQSYITLQDPGVPPNREVESYREIEEVPVRESTPGDPGDPTPYQYVFRGIVVKYRVDDAGAETGQEATITTDIVIEVPYINFFQDSSRILEYALIANQGIYFKNAFREVMGNVYAGISETSANVADYCDEAVPGGLNLLSSTVKFESNYLVSKGDINIRASDLTIGNTAATTADTQVWAESVRTVEGKNSVPAAPGATGTTTIFFVDDTPEGWIANDQAVMWLVDNTSGHDWYVMTTADNKIWSVKVPDSAYNISFMRYDKDQITRWNEWSAGGRDGKVTYRAEGSGNGQWTGDTYNISSNAAEPSTLTVNGNMYVANDLELNAGGSTVNLNGAYYGYNNGRYASYPTWENKGEFAERYEYKDHTQNSSMIINGKDSTLNLSGLETLILAGVAYVDMTSKSDSDVPATSSIQEYATGESLALKANQYMYLAPSSNLTTTNPVEVSEAHANIADVWSSEILDGWFGFKGGFVNSTDPIVQKDVVTNNGTYRYYYLKFYNEAAQKAYAEFILNMQDPVTMDAALLAEYTAKSFDISDLNEAWKIKKSLQGRVDATGVKVSDGITAKIYTRGAMSITSGTSVESLLVPDDRQLSLDSNMDIYLNRHYIWLYDYLDAKEGISLSKDPGDIEPKAISDNLPASSFVDFAELANAAGGIETDYRNSLYHTVISAGDVSLSTNFNGIIICKGNVTIPDGVSVKGLVIAGRKILIEGTGSIEANRSVVQAILDEEMREASKKGIAGEKKGYAITYLTDIKVNYSGTDNTHRISGTDYTEYMSYVNWRKGEID